MSHSGLPLKRLIAKDVETIYLLWVGFWGVEVRRSTVNSPAGSDAKSRPPNSFCYIPALLLRVLIFDLSCLTLGSSDLSEDAFLFFIVFFESLASLFSLALKVTSVHIIS